MRISFTIDSTDMERSYSSLSGKFSNPLISGFFRYLQVIFLIVFIPLLVHSENILLIDPTVSFNIGKQVAYFQDDSKALTINNILSPDYQSQFKTYHKDVFTHPVTRGAFWFKISIENKSGSAAWLQLGTINARYIDFYAPDSNGIYSHPLLTGVMRGESSNPIR
ncbi:MAG: hypothetical protein IPH84_19515 [Bacteroidales bacterium]|nr:hypothetical protein [Bacteroidales bacterium]